jgi:hypothetical protein
MSPYFKSQPPNSYEAQLKHTIGHADGILNQTVKNPDQMQSEINNILVDTAVILFDSSHTSTQKQDFIKQVFTKANTSMIERFKNDNPNIIKQELRDYVKTLELYLGSYNSFIKSESLDSTLKNEMKKLKRDFLQNMKSQKIQEKLIKMGLEYNSQGMRTNGHQYGIMAAYSLVQKNCDFNIISFGNLTRFVKLFLEGIDKSAEEINVQVALDINGFLAKS